MSAMDQSNNNLDFIVGKYLIFDGKWLKDNDIYIVNIVDDKQIIYSHDSEKMYHESFSKFGVIINVQTNKDFVLTSIQNDYGVYIYLKIPKKIFSNLEVFQTMILNHDCCLPIVKFTNNLMFGKKEDIV